MQILAARKYATPRNGPLSLEQRETRRLAYAIKTLACFSADFAAAAEEMAALIYLSLDWTETGEYSIVEVYALSDAFYECLQHPVRYAVPGTTTELLGGSLSGMTWDIYLERAAKDRKILGIKVLRDITNMGLAEAKAVAEGLPKTVRVVHLGDVESLKQQLLEGGFDFQISASV